MPAPTTRYPSPPPPDAPTASTPGPRAAALTRIFESALATTIRTHSYANFSACFPTPAKHCPAALEGVWKQLNTKLEDGCRGEFEAILSERGVVQALNEWDGVLDDARRKQARAVEGAVPERPPHALSAEQLYTAYLGPHLQEATELIDAKLQSTQAENAKAIEKIAAQRKEMEKLVGDLETLVRDVESSVQVMNEGTDNGVEGLRAEAWEIESEVRAVS
ncbi:MAG: hypothetical protein Q9160_001768 [Pyrenula sp. 1 TL-2023]